MIDPAEKSDIEVLHNEIRDLRKEIHEALRIIRGDYLTIADISHELGRSREWIRKRPWILPNYGIPDTGTRPMKWKRATWESWKEHLEEHRREWEKMSVFERQKVRSA